MEVRDWNGDHKPKRKLYLDGKIYGVDRERKFVEVWMLHLIYYKTGHNFKSWHGKRDFNLPIIVNSTGFYSFRRRHILV